MKVQHWERGVFWAGLLAGLGTPAQAGPAEVAMLQAYVGSWTGAGVLKGGEAPTPLECTLTVNRANQGKINFAGKCSVLRAAGTIAYFDATQRYEAAMTSNADFAGVAVGRTAGDDIVFALKDRAADKKGNDLALNADMVLRGGAIVITFKAVLNGDPWSGEVEFRK